MGVVEEKVRQAAEEPKVVEALVRLPLELNLTSINTTTDSLSSLLL
jgi:hypothetical protein